MRRRDLLKLPAVAVCGGVASRRKRQTVKSEAHYLGTHAALATALRSAFGVQTASLLIDDDAWGCREERYGNDAYLFSVNLAAHQCVSAEEADITLELWAYTENDSEFEWFIDWQIQAPLDGHWPFHVLFCPLCGVDLRTFHQCEVAKIPYERPRTQVTIT